MNRVVDERYPARSGVVENGKPHVEICCGGVNSHVFTMESHFVS